MPKNGKIDSSTNFISQNLPKNKSFVNTSHVRHLVMAKTSKSSISKTTCPILIILFFYLASNLTDFNIYLTQQICKTHGYIFKKKLLNYNGMSHIFRTTRQNPNESVVQFVTRLRQKAETCSFENLEERLIEQVIEHCSSEKLRLKFLKAGKTPTLQTLQEMA